MTTREDDATGTPPHGDPLRERAAEGGAQTTRHGVQLDPRGEPADADRRRTDETGRPASDAGERA